MASAGTKHAVPWAGGRSQMVRSRCNGDRLLIRTGSTNGASYKQRESIRSLRLPKVHSYTIIEQAHKGQVGYWNTVHHLVEPVGRRFTIKLPYGDHELVTVGSNQYIRLRGCGMKGLEVAVHVDSGDAIIESIAGEYLQWHEESDLKSVWWSCPKASLNRTIAAILNVPDRLNIESNMAEAAVCVRGDNDGPRLLPVEEAMNAAKNNSNVLDFFVVDYPGFSICWMSPESHGKDRPASQFGEVSLVFEDGRNDLVAEFMQLSATRAIGSNALAIIDLMSPSGGR